MGIAFSFEGTGGQGEWGLQQTLTATLQPFTQYTLQVEIGNIASGEDVAGNDYNLAGFPGYRLDLMAGAVVLEQDDNSLAALLAEGEFQTSTVTFTTGASHPQLGQALTIRLVNLNLVDNTTPTTATADLEVDFDDVRLDAIIIPEPATALLLVALPCLAATRRRTHVRGKLPTRA